MASKTSLSTVLFLSMNFLFFAFVSTASTYPTPSSSSPKARPSSGRSQSNPTTNPSNGQSSPTPNPSNGQSSPTPNPSNGQSSPTPNPSNGQSSPTPNRPSTGQASPTPAPAPSQPASCPRDALKFGVCANLLGGLIGLSIGTPPTTPCCPLIVGLADLEAAICLCTAIKANVLNIINLSIPLSLSVILDACERRVPAGFTCA